MEQDKIKNVPVYDRELANVLIQKGFLCVDKCSNYKVKGKTVYFFENKDEVKDVIHQYSLKKGRTIFKIRNRKVANELISRGYEFIQINSNKTDGEYFVFKWTPSIYDESVEIRESMFSVK